MSQHVRKGSLNTNRTHVEHLPHDQRHKQSFRPPASPPISLPSQQLTYTHSVPIIPTPASTAPPPPRPAIPTPTPTLLLLLLRMRIPAQRANDRAAQRPDAGPQQHVADDAAGAGAEEAVARLVRCLLLVLAVVVVVFVGVVVGVGTLRLLLLLGWVAVLWWGVAVRLLGVVAVGLWGRWLGVGVVLGMGLLLLLLLLVVRRHMSALRTYS